MDGGGGGGSGVVASASAAANDDAAAYMEVPILFPSLERDTAPVYLVDDVRRKLVAVSPFGVGGDDTSAGATTADDNNSRRRYNSSYVDTSRLSGAASVSTLRGCGSTITTTLLAEKPWILSVSLLPSGGSSNNPNPSTMHLDFSRTQIFNDVVKIQAFLLDDDERGRNSSTAANIRLILVDRCGVIMKLTLKYDNNNNNNEQQQGNYNKEQLLDEFEPYENLDVIQLSDLLDDDHKDQISSSDSIRTSMVACWSHRHVLIGMNPFLIAVDIGDGTGSSYNNNPPRCVVWVRGICVDNMRQRASFFRNSMRKTYQNLLGVEYPTTLHDLEPVAAITVADNEEGSADNNLITIFTLHSDGKMYLWTVPNPTSSNNYGGGHSSSLLNPYSAMELRGGIQRDLPPPEQWSDRFHSTQLAAKLVKNNTMDDGDGQDEYVLALHIQVQGGGRNDNNFIREIEGEVDGPNSNADDGTTTACTTTEGSVRLWVVRGTVDPREEADTPSCWGRMSVPLEATGVVGMAFHGSNSNNYETLLVLLQNENNKNDIIGHPKALLVSYPTSQDDVQNSNLHGGGVLPSFCPSEYLLDHLAFEERRRIENLFINVSAENNDLPAALHLVDQRYLRYLFRPTIARGTGSVLPPPPVTIRGALNKLVPYHHHQLGSSSKKSIELEVLENMHEWRRRDNRQEALSSAATATTPRRRTRTDSITVHHPTPGTDTVTTATMPSNLYDSLVPMDEGNNDQRDIEEEVEAEQLRDGGMQIDNDVEEDKYTTNTEEQIQAHEARWKQLLQEIWSEEATERMPLCLASSCSGDNALIVRLGATSALIKLPVKSDGTSTAEENTNALSTFDKAALELLTAIESDEVAFRKLAQLEQTFGDIVSRGDYGALAKGQWQPQILDIASTKDDVVGRIMKEDGSTNGNNSLSDLFEAAECELLAAFEQVPIVDLPGLCFLHHNNNTDRLPFNAATASAPSAGRQLRLAATCLCVRGLDSTRRILLGRSLLLPMLQFGTDLDFLAKATARMYFQSLAELWTAAQHVPMSSGFATSFPSFASASSVSPPQKRPSFGPGCVLSILNIPDETSVLDVLVLQIGDTMQKQQGSMSLSSSVVALGTVATARCLQFAPALGSVPVAAAAGSDESSSNIPELGLLTSATSRDPRLVLRLLAPAMAIPCSEEQGLIDRRTELFGKCLLASAHYESDDECARTMADRAFELLSFDPHDLPRSMDRLDVLNQIVGENSVLNRALLGFIERAIDKMDHTFPLDVVRSKSSYIKLLSTLFNTSLVVREWNKAFISCVRRSTDFKRLIRAMVDRGALGELLRLCHTASDTSTEAFSNGVNLYEIAAETLGSAGFRDLYLFRVTNTNPLSDYFGALYALNASLGDWRNAAQALDLVLMNATNALRRPMSEELDTEKAEERERLIVDDLLLSSIAVYNAVTLVDDENCRFIVSGECGNYPIHRHEHSSPKRPRGLSQSTADATTKVEKLGLHYMDLNELYVQAAMTSVLSTLFYDETVELTTVKAALLDNLTVDSITQNIENIVGFLFEKGYYQGLIVPSALSRQAHGSKPGGLSIFNNALNLLLCDYLVPLAVNLKHTPPRPALRQLNQALEFLSGNMPPVLVGSRSKKASALPLASIRLGASTLLHSTCARYSTAEMPLVVEVARCILSEEVCLPPWLETLLLKGTDGVGTSCGLFAGRYKPGSCAYQGDPSALLTMYMKHGMYSEACKVVTNILDELDSSDRKKKAPQRLAEKGDIDYVPYRKIDLLWNCTEVALTKGIFKGEEEQNMKASRKRMEEALENHFALLKISEIGRASAVLLSSTS